MEILWGKILLPLLLLLAILFVFGLIVTLWGYLLNMIAMISSQAKVRRTIRKHVKLSCREMEDNINELFDNLLKALDDAITIEDNEDNEDE